MGDGGKSVHDDLMRATKSTLSALQQFMTALLDYLEKNSEYAGHKALAQWIKDGHGVRMYKVRGDCTEDLHNVLTGYKVPHILLDTSDGSKCIIIRDVDAEICQKANREVLVSRGNYYQEVSGKELENAIGKSAIIKNKEILTISGLDEVTAEVLKHKCNNIAKGFMVGIDEMKDEDGNVIMDAEDEKGERCLYNLSVHASRLINFDTEKTDFCKAYIQTIFSVNGPNGDTKRQQVLSDEDLERRLISLATDLNEDITFVGGANDPFQFIEINKNGFEYYNSIYENGERKDKLVLSVDRDSIGYLDELQRITDRIKDKVITKNYSEIQSKLNGTEQNLVTDRPQKNAMQAITSSQEKLLIDEIDKLIKVNLSSNIKFATLENNDKLKMYQEEFIKVFEALKENHSLDEYDIESLRELKTSALMQDFDYNAYSHCIEIIQNSSIETHQAKITAIDKDITITTQTQTTNTQEIHSSVER